MAGEININLTVAGKVGDQSISLSKQMVMSFDTGAHGLAGLPQTVLTSSAALPAVPADIIAEGLSRVFIKNTDANNPVLVYYDSGATQQYATVWPGHIEPFAPYCAAGANPKLYLKSTGASVAIQVFAIGKLLTTGV